MLFVSAKPVPAGAAPTLSYRETAIMLYPRGKGFDRQKSWQKLMFKQLKI